MSNMNDEVRNTQALALANASPRALRRVGIIGATSMGVGIAMDLLEANVPVTLFEIGREALDQRIALVRSAYQNAVAQGTLTQDQHDRRMALLAGTVNFHHLKDSDLVIDTVCTNMAGREKLFRRLDQAAKPGAILMTLASRTGVDQLARCTRRAGEVLGLHVPDAAEPDQVWELVPGAGTSGETLATVIALARKLHHVATVSDVGHGSVIQAGNGSRPPETGVGAWQVDQAQE